MAMTPTWGGACSLCSSGWNRRDGRAHQPPRHSRLLAEPPRRSAVQRNVQVIGALNLTVQFGLCRCQIVEGDVAMKIRQNLPTRRVGYFQIAGVPMRREPDRGEPLQPVRSHRRSRRRLRLARVGRMRIPASTRRGGAGDFGWIGVACDRRQGLKRSKVGSLACSFAFHTAA